MYWVSSETSDKHPDCKRLSNFMLNDFFGFQRMQDQEAVKAFYGPAYELIKSQESENRRMDSLLRSVKPDLVDEYSAQISE